MSKQYRTARKKYHIIYLTTCTVTGRYYIGMHSTDDLNDGYIGSGKRLWQSIKKHGRENHVMQVVEHCRTRTELRIREAEHVNEERLREDPFCMNLTLGGADCGRFDKIPLEQVKAASAAGNEAYRARIANDENLKLRLQQHMTGVNRRMAVDVKAGVRKTPPGFLDQKHTAETISKMKAAKAGVHQGSMNPQAGKVWLNKDGKAKIVSKEQAEALLALGWRLGRVPDLREREHCTFGRVWVNDGHRSMLVYPSQATGYNKGRLKASS